MKQTCWWQTNTYIGCKFEISMASWAVFHNCVHSVSLVLVDIVFVTVLTLLLFDIVDEWVSDTEVLVDCGDLSSDFIRNHWRLYYAWGEGTSGKGSFNFFGMLSPNYAFPVLKIKLLPFSPVRWSLPDNQND